MHKVQRDVKAMHEKFGVPVGDVHERPTVRRGDFRAALIEEEAQETIAALRKGDLVEAIDGMCDLLCVVYGTAVECGVDLAPFWEEVHRSNMAKENPVPGTPGKLLKPPGWTPPQLASILAAL